MPFIKCQLLIIALLLLPLQTKANDIKFTVGSSIYYTKINDPNFDFIGEWNPIKNISSINLGVSAQNENIIYRVTSNRLFNRSVERKVRSKKNGQVFINKTNIVNDTFYLGYQINRIQPSLFISKAIVEKSLHSQGGMILKQENIKTILYGFNLGYSINKNTQILGTFVFPNRKLYLEAGLGLGVNFIF